MKQWWNTDRSCVAWLEASRRFASFGANRPRHHTKFYSGSKRHYINEGPSFARAIIYTQQSCHRYKRMRLRRVSLSLSQSLRRSRLCIPVTVKRILSGRALPSHWQPRSKRACRNVERFNRISRHQNAPQGQPNRVYARLALHFGSVDYNRISRPLPRCEHAELDAIVIRLIHNHYHHFAQLQTQ